MEKFFHLKERGTNVRTEIVAGVTTFMAMGVVSGIKKRSPAARRLGKPLRQ